MMVKVMSSVIYSVSVSFFILNAEYLPLTTRYSLFQAPQIKNNKQI